jgi:hypothetical protein
MPERPWNSREEDHVSIPANQSAAFKLFHVSTRLGSSISGKVDAVSESVSSGVDMQSSKLFNHRISGSNSSSSGRSSIASREYIIYFLIFHSSGLLYTYKISKYTEHDRSNFRV